ncbi:MAG: hypothetical protein NC081_02845 [Roseburia sp.]|nr:hypothetical protein [Roseburia sp.]
MEKESLRIKSACVQGGYIWTVPVNMAGLYRIDPVSGVRKCVCRLEYENQETWYFTCPGKDKIWGISEQRRPLRVFSYDLMEEKLAYYESYGVESRTYISVEYEGIIYSFFRDVGEGCLCFDTDNKTFYFEQIWEATLRNAGVQGKIFSHFCEGEHVYFTLSDTSYILYYNLRTKEMNLLDTGVKLQGIAVKSGIYYCITAVGREVIMIDPVTGNSNKVVDASECVQPYFRIFRLGSKILLLGANELDDLNEEKGEILRCEVSGSVERLYPRSSLFVANCSVNSLNCLLPFCADRLLVFDEKGELRTTYFPELMEEEVRQLNTEMLLRKGVAEEGEELSLEAYMKYLKWQEEREVAMKKEAM